MRKLRSLYLDLEDDVDGAGEIGSRESRGSDELDIGMIEQLPPFTTLIVLYVLLQDKLKIFNITK